MSANQKVLIVDDEPRNQRIITETLDGFVDFQTANSGEDALAMLDTFKPDLVLLDIMMPGIDGYEVCKRIRARAESTPIKVILVSGKAMLEERLKGYEVGADDYMTKPFVPEELLAKAKVFLRLTAVEKELADINRNLEQKVEDRTAALLATEAKLITSAKMAALGEMAGGIAHEINTPLGTIGMIAEQIEELVSETSPDVKSIKEMTAIISKTVQRIGSIIQGLRTFSRDGSRDKFDDVPLKQVLDDTLILCQEKIKHSKVNIQCGNLPRDLKVHCRPVQISQVLLNLIGNACDAVSSLPEKWIKIDTIRKESCIEISITDSGNGIPENIRGKIFDPFFTTKEIGKGTGLGLSISKGIMDAHHGTMCLDDKSSHTRFIISLPIPVSEVKESQEAA